MNAPAHHILGALSAHELAAMPLTQARKALESQEIAWMQVNHARLLLKELQDRGESVGRVQCASLSLRDRQFRWEAFAPCGACATTGSLVGADSKEYPCPNCSDNDPDTFVTDYDGRLVGESFS